MKRSAFLRFVSLGSFGLFTLSYTKLFGKLSEASVRVQPLDITEHVRHGLMSNNAKNNSPVSWINHLSKSVYYENGISPSDKDLTSYHFISGMDRLHIQHLNNQLTINDLKSIREFDLNSKNKNVFQNKRFNVVQKIADSQEETISVTENSLIIPLNNEYLNLKGENIKPGSYGIATGAGQLSIAANSKTNYLILSKINYA